MVAGRAVYMWYGRLNRTHRSMSSVRYISTQYVLRQLYGDGHTCLCHAHGPLPL